MSRRSTWVSGTIQYSPVEISLETSELEIHRRQFKYLSERYARLGALSLEELPPDTRPSEVQRRIDEWSKLGTFEALANEGVIFREIERLHEALDEYLPPDDYESATARQADMDSLREMIIKYTSNNFYNVQDIPSNNGQREKFRKTIIKVLGYFQSMSREDREHLTRCRDLLYVRSLESARQSLRHNSNAEQRTNSIEANPSQNVPRHMSTNSSRTSRTHRTSNGSNGGLSRASTSQTNPTTPSTDGRCCESASQVSYSGLNRGDTSPTVSRTANPEPIIQEFDEDGNLIRANLEGLYCRLVASTQSSRKDGEFRKIFLMAHQIVTTTGELLEFFASQIVVPYDQESDRVLNSLKFLLSICGLDDVASKNRITGLIHRINGERVAQTIVDPPISINHGTVPMSDVEMFTRQLVNIEVSLFKRITIYDYITWIDRGESQMPIRLSQFLSNNDAITNWCQCDILFETRYDDEQSRAQAITFWCTVANRCVRMDAYSTADAIVKGLTSSLIEPLICSWRNVDSSVYREALNNRENNGVLPLLRLHLKDVRTQQAPSVGPIRLNIPAQTFDFKAITRLFKIAEKLHNYQVFVLAWPENEEIMADMRGLLLRIQSIRGLQEKFFNRSNTLADRERRASQIRQPGLEDAGFRKPVARRNRNNHSLLTVAHGT